MRICSERRAAGARFAEEVSTLFSTASTRSQADGPRRSGKAGDGGTTPKLRLSGMGMDWLKEELKRNPNAAAHVELPDGRVAFTGRTEAVQAFITKHLDETGAWNAMFEDGLARSDARPAEKPKAQ